MEVQRINGMWKYYEPSSSSKSANRFFFSFQIMNPTMPRTPIPAATDKPMIAPVLTPPPPPLFEDVDVGVPEEVVLEAVKEPVAFVAVNVITAMEDVVVGIDEVESGEEEDEEESLVEEEVEGVVEDELDDEEVEEEELLLDELDGLVDKVDRGKVVVAAGVEVGSAGVELSTGSPPMIPALLLSP
jgi:hypothetical protein